MLLPVPAATLRAQAPFAYQIKCCKEGPKSGYVALCCNYLCKLALYLLHRIFLSRLFLCETHVLFIGSDSVHHFESVFLN